MIKITKGDIPLTLAEHGADWTQELLDAVAADGPVSEAVKTRYRNPDIKDAIIIETHGKCAYCETKILHTQYGDIEHFVPKSLEPAKAFEWENLTLACKICNVRKSSKDPYAESIIDPYSDDPEEHLAFCGAVLFATGSEKGIETKAKLGLNRAELCERRRETLERLLSLIEAAQNPHLSIEARKAIYEDFVAVELADSAQYAAMARSLHRQVQPSVEAQWAA